MPNLKSGEQGPSINRTMESPKPACQPQTWNRAVGSFLWPSLFFKGVYNVGITLFGLRKFLELAGADDLTSDLVSAILALPACAVVGLSRYDSVKHRSEKNLEWILQKRGYLPPESYLEKKRKTKENNSENKYKIEWEKYSTWGCQNIILRLMWALLILTTLLMTISTGMFAYLGAVTFINEPYKWISRSQHVPHALEISIKCFAALSAIFNMYTYYGYSVRRAMEGGMAIAAYGVDPEVRKRSSGPVFWGTALMAIPITVANFMNGYFYSVHSFALLPLLSVLTASESSYLAIALRVFGVIFKLCSRVFSIFKFLDSGKQKNESKTYIPMPKKSTCIGLSFFGSMLLFAMMDVVESVIGNFVSTNTLLGDFNINIFSLPLVATVLTVIVMVAFVNLFEGFVQYTYTDFEMLKTASRLVEKAPQKIESETNSESLKVLGNMAIKRDPKETDPLLDSKQNSSNSSFWSWLRKPAQSTYDESEQALPNCACCFK